MKRIDTSTAVPDMFGVGKPGYRDGDPLAGIPATALNAAAFNNLQEELCSVIEGAGIALDGAKRNQLLTAVKAIVSGSGLYSPASVNNIPAWSEN